MPKLRTFLRAGWSEQRLLLAAGFWVVVVRVGLTLLPFRTLRRWLSRARSHTATRRRISDVTPHQIAQAVMVTSRHVPGASCLTQALAAQVLLERYGYPTQLRIGVNRGESGRLEAHAWVECQGTMIIGGEVAEEFTALEGELG